MPNRLFDIFLAVGLFVGSGSVTVLLYHQLPESEVQLVELTSGIMLGHNSFILSENDISFGEFSVDLTKSKGYTLVIDGTLKGLQDNPTSLSARATFNPLGQMTRLEAHWGEKENSGFLSTQQVFPIKILSQFTQKGRPHNLNMSVPLLIVLSEHDGKYSLQGHGTVDLPSSVQQLSQLRLTRTELQKRSQEGENTRNL